MLLDAAKGDRGRLFDRHGAEVVAPHDRADTETGEVRFCSLAPGSILRFGPDGELLRETRRLDAPLTFLRSASPPASEPGFPDELRG